MGKILIISPSFAPQAFVGGVRTTMFAKYLTLLGWDVWVITRVIPTEDPVMDSGMQVDLPPSLQDKIIRISNPSEHEYIGKRNWTGKFRDFFYPEYSSPPGFLDLAIPIGEELIKTQNFDIILASVPDQWGVTLGEMLAQKASCKFVVDFRDIYEQEKSDKRSLQEKVHLIRMLWRRHFTNRKADLITTVSQFHKKILEDKLSKRTEVIYNGYDDAIFKATGFETTDILDSTFTISYLGRILNDWYHNPAILFQALSELSEEGELGTNDLKINFYGVDQRKLSDYLTDENKTFVQFFPRVSMDQVVEIMKSSQALLLITNQGREGVLTTKFFEYAGVQKPIVCVPGDGAELQELIETHHFGVAISSVKAMKAYLLAAVKDFRKGNWPTKVDSNPEFFTRKNQTIILSDLLKSLVQ